MSYYAPHKHRFIAHFESAPAPPQPHYDPDYASTDPGTATFNLVEVGGGTTSYVYGTDGEVAQESTGYYSAEVFLTAGSWWGYWTSDGTSGGTVTATNVSGTVVVLSI